eukprot:CAMPEP_0204446570 /NCGR_PEP_ID=MMETSP0470-20130426/94936_1 /ASSEMBLY_ACC=CAM_ASM_000385 /TAXON_ID=2969 /ORGANISM="Oxyrrhis marina" /LENGTH=66 /DNA_ID=CAMNT_0051446167 /DNA_START=244 /DNA_END=442 /DNA_ORIENTATION=+
MNGQVNEPLGPLAGYGVQRFSQRVAPLAPWLRPQASVKKGIPSTPAASSASVKSSASRNRRPTHSL